MLFDHQIPADSISAAENHVMMRTFAREQGIYNYDIKEGVCHQVVPEKGRVKPGDIVVGRIPIPVRTALLVHFRQVSARLIWHMS